MNNLSWPFETHRMGFVLGRNAVRFFCVVLAVLLSGCPVQSGIPSFVGLTQTDAELRIVNAGYAVGTITEVFSDEPLGNVVGQSPAAGSAVSLGTTIDLQISRGLPGAIPNVIGMTREEAELALTEGGFTVGEITEQASSQPAGMVLNQSPAPGSAASPDTAVNLTVSAGATAQQIAVPRVVGLQSAEAGVLIATAGLRVGAIVMVESAGPPGEVLSQDPAAGAMVDPNSEIDISVSISGSVPAATVPAITGGSATEAGTALTGAGLSLGTVTEVFSAGAVGTVVGQTPPAGSIVLPGATVDIQVSKGPEPATVPELVGLQSAVAGVSIASARLSLGTVTMVESTAPPGEVLSQNPAAGNIVAAGSPVALNISGSAGSVAVPNVTGSTEAMANATFLNAGLVRGMVTHVFSDQPVGQVIAQRPSAGTLVLLGSAVDIDVSKGGEIVAVPDVVGRQSAQAGALIAGARLQLGSVTEMASDAPVGEVLSQSPAAGTMTSVNTAVNIAISESATGTAVPDLSGETESEANTTLTGEGLVLGPVVATFSGAPVGQVVGQTPAAGTLVLLGSAVSINVSAGVEMITVPDVVGVQQALAGATIAGARLTLGTVTELVSTASAGQVVGQSPAAGANVTVGTAVSIEISSGAEIKTVPDLVSLDLEAARASVATEGLLLGVLSATAQITDPAIMVLTQNPPAGSMVAEGSEVILTVSIPPDAGNFLSLVNTPVVESEETALAYYAAIDPLNEKTTLNDWFTANGFGGPTGVEVAANYFNEFDLGFGRQVLMRSEGGNTAYAVLNHGAVDDTWQDPNHPIVSVCMELTPAAAGGDPFIKYFTFGPDGNRILSVDLDGRGEKFQPGMCSSCHGGQPLPLVDGVYPRGGDVGARFIPFDLESFLYSEINDDYDRATQEDALKTMNSAVLDSYDVVRRHRFAYDGPSVDIPDANSTGVSIPLVVSGLVGTIADINISFEGTGSCAEDGDPESYGLNHTYVGDLVITLFSPTGTPVVLINQQGESGDNLCNTVLDDEATDSIVNDFQAPFTGAWLSSGALANFDGEDPNGTWTLEVADLASFDVGAVNRWSLSLTLEGDEATAAEALVEGWYGGPSLPGDFNDNFVPVGWQGGAAEALYKDVFKHNCRNCHIQFTERLPSFDFDSFSEFDAAKSRIRELVFVKGNMPAALRTYDSFWLGTGPNAATELATFVGHGTSGPGASIANAGIDRMVVAGDTVNLDGSQSVFATTYAWEFVSKPGGSGATLTAETTAMPSFTTDLPGTYIVALSVSSGGEASTPDTITITATLAVMPVSFANQVVDIFSDCSGCHTGNPGPNGLFLNTDDANILYNEVAVEASTLANPTPRVNIATPTSSLLLRLPSGELGHSGGQLSGFGLNGMFYNYDIILRWIQEGANID